MELTGPFLTLGIALGLGMLVGLQRERSPSSTHIGGIRTFPLVTVLGATTAMLTPTLGPWLAVAAFLGVVAAGILANVIGMRQGDPEPGMTTEVAMMVMFIVGAMLGSGIREVAIAVGVGTTILLQFKEQLHGLAKKVGDRDIRAVLQFAIITFIVLPVLPDQTYGPFDVLNPHRLWLMVVLVVGISLAGYVAYRMIGGRHGTAVAGLLGGVISSTATTVSYARRMKDAVDPAAILPGTLAVLLVATAVMYARVIVLIAVSAPTHAVTIGAPLGAIGVLTILLAVAALARVRDGAGAAPDHENPAELRGALIFAAMYGTVILVVAAAKHYFGDAGLYVAAGLSGLTDMDAITLSSTRLAERGRLEPETVWRALMLASVSNLAFKTWVVWGLGGRRLAGRLAIWFGIIALASGAVLVFWPW